MIPIHTNIRPRRTPYANYALIISNVIIFFLTYSPLVNPFTREVIQILRPWAKGFMLTPLDWRWWQFVSYAFLHGSYMHIIGNMLFLYIFGNNVNDKLGHIGYLAFYMAGGIFAGIGHTLLHSSPVVGASGAIAAVTGAYLVLFPQSLITIIYWFIFIGTLEVPALYFIIFKLILIDNVIARIPGAIAYNAHLVGYAFGIAAMLILLAVGLITGSHSDMWAMIKRWNRRRQYRDVVSGGYDPFSGQTGVKHIKVEEVKPEGGKQQEEKIHGLRSEISKRMSERNLSAAAEMYLELMGLDSEQVLPRQQLLDIANQLASENRASEAAGAYEQFLNHYGNYEYAEQVELMLGLLYSRYLNQRELAVKHLKAAVEKLTDAGQLKMCKEELARL